MNISNSAKVPHGYWNNINNQKYFLDQLANTLNIVTPSGWDEVTSALLRKHGGGSLLQKYDNSMTRLFSTVYRGYKWRYSYLPRGHWNNLATQRSFMDKILKKLNITMDNHSWHKITVSSVQQHGGSGLLKKYKDSLGSMLATVYPEYKQFCRLFAMNVVRDMKLATLEDLIHIPLQYPPTMMMPLTLLSDVAPGSRLLKQHDNSIHKRTAKFQ